jgi:hypothetical protein
MKDFNQYKTDLGFKESSNIYTKVNYAGFMGRYQFGSPRLSDLGYKGTRSNFLNNPALQEEYFLKHVADYAKRFFPKLTQAKQKHGSWLTLSGIIAYAHLLGAGQANKWINSGTDKTDGNGVAGKTYATMFSGYDIPGYVETGEEISSVAKGATKIPGLNLGGVKDVLPAILLIGFILGIIYYYKQ